VEDAINKFRPVQHSKMAIYFFALHFVPSHKCLGSLEANSKFSFFSGNHNVQQLIKCTEIFTCKAADNHFFFLQTV
jgi:hypothetical protein